MVSTNVDSSPVDVSTRTTFKFVAVNTLKAKLKTVDAFAVPLELVYKGPSSITARADGRYLEQVLRWVGQQQTFEATTLRARLMAEDDWKFGLTHDVADLFLYYLLGAQDFRAEQAGRSVTVQALGQIGRAVQAGQGPGRDARPVG